MRVLVFARYARLGASSRLRILQYLPFLARDGIHTTVSSLFSDDYVLRLQTNRRSVLRALSSYANRIRKLRSARQFDLLWIEKDALPWAPFILEQPFLSRTPYVVDYDDAVFHHYDRHPSALVRVALRGKHPSLMRGASTVIAGNDYLAQFARASGARRVVVIPTSVDVSRYGPAPDNRAAAAPPCVGWIGQRSTAEYLRPLAPVFRRLTSAQRARFAAIGIDAPGLGLPMEPVHWAENTEARSLRGLDVGIMPLVDGPFERGKCGYKLIQYMATGLPVIASPVGVNRHIVEHGVTGFLADGAGEWERALDVLLGDSHMRRRMGEAGRRKVERSFSTSVAGPRIARALREAAA